MGVLSEMLKWELDIIDVAKPICLVCNLSAAQNTL